MTNQIETKESFKLVMLASVFTLILWFIPFAEVITYPVRLFVTFIHEAGHALATVLSLGSVHQIELYTDGSGVTETMGGMRLLISSAGYLSTIFFGAGILLLLRKQKYAKPLALITAALLVMVTVLWGGNILAWAVGMILGGALLGLAFKGKPGVAHFVMSFLGVQSILNALYDLRTLLYLSAFTKESTDAANMSIATGGFIPPIFWALGWSLISVVMLALTVMVYYRSINHRAALDPVKIPQLLPDDFNKVFDKKL
ncbi:MAG: M50 family metallopeptidase [Acidobacteriota bacterium]